MPDTIKLTGRYVRQDGSPARGYVDFQLSATLVNATGNLIASRARHRTPLAGDGTISIDLVPTDNPAYEPSGVTYAVTETIQDAPERRYNINIPYNAAGGTIDLSDLVPADTTEPITYGVTTATFEDHSARHELAGADVLNVAGLSGVLADAQTPAVHDNTAHSTNYASEAALTAHDVATGVHGVNGHVAGDAALAFERMRNVTTAAIGTDPTPVDGIGDYIYGSKSGLWRTNDEGETWTLVTDTIGGVNGVRPTADGEVIIITSGALYRSSGWDDNPLTATFASVLSSPGDSSFIPFSVNVEGARVFATTYQAGSAPWADSRYAWLSTDNGQNFTQVFDLADYHSDQTTAHMHLAAIDPWADNRLWISWHGGAERAIQYSDNDGTTWVTLTSVHQPTVGIATEHGMVFGTDFYPNGVLHVRHRDDPTDMVVEIGIQLRYGRGSTLIGFAVHGYRDTRGVVHMCWQNHSDIPAIMTASDGIRADEVLRFDPEAGGNQITRFGIANGRMMARLVQDTVQTVRADVPLRGTRSTNDLNSGGILDGDATTESSVAAGWGSIAGQTAVAIGVGADADDAHATAVGYASRAGMQSTVLGHGAQALSTTAVAIGYGSRADGARRIAIGWSAISGGDAIAIGHQADAGTFSIAIGRDVNIEPGNVVIGYQATGTQQRVIVVGFKAAATAVDSVALGYEAAAIHADSVALGASTTTTAANQVMVGPRDVEINDPARGYILPSPNGTRYRITVADDGSLTTTEVV